MPLEGGLWLKARETWPRASRVYCHPVPGADIALLEVVERVAVLHCERRGPVVDLVLDRAQNRRAQFVFTTARGRAMIFWQTAKAAANARPGLRVPSRRAVALEHIVVDTREKYGYSFRARELRIERAALRVGDYAGFIGETCVAVVERKTIDDFCGALVDGSLSFAMADLARLPATAVVVEGTYSQLLRRGFVDGAWLAEIVARLHVRYPTVPIVFVETRALGERWTFDFFAAAAAEREPPPELADIIVEPARARRGTAKKRRGQP